MKRTSAFLLAICVLLSVSFTTKITAKASFAYPGEVITGSLTFRLNNTADGYYVAVCTSWDAYGELVIPETINGLPVTAIGAYPCCNSPNSYYHW